MIRLHMRSLFALLTAVFLFGATPAVAETRHDVVIRGGTIYDGSGGAPYAGEVAIDGDRIAYVGPPRGLRGRATIDATRQGGRARASSTC